jgi:hypothetical protein
MELLQVGIGHPLFRLKADYSTVGIKVGGVISPYTPVYQASSFLAPTDWQQFSYTFAAGSSSFGVGVVFQAIITSGTFCVDDVMLVFVGV